MLYVSLGGAILLGFMVFGVDGQIGTSSCEDWDNLTDSSRFLTDVKT